MKFNELSDQAQTKAVQDYIDGWNENRADDSLDLYDVWSILRHDLDYEYDENGNLLIGDE